MFSWAILRANQRILDGRARAVATVRRAARTRRTGRAIGRATPPAVGIVTAMKPVAVVIGAIEQAALLVPGRAIAELPRIAPEHFQERTAAEPHCAPVDVVVRHHHAGAHGRIDVELDT